MVALPRVWQIASLVMTCSLAISACAAGGVKPAAPECGWELQAGRSLDGGWADNRFVRFRRPVSISAGTRDLWILDAGHGAIFRLEPGDRLQRFRTVSLAGEGLLRVDGFGLIYLSDRRSGVVRILDETGAMDREFRSPDPSPSRSLALGSGGQVLVGDDAGRVQVFNTFGGLEEVLMPAGGPFGTAAGIAVDRETVYVSDPLLRVVHVLQQGRVTGFFSHPELASPGPLAVDMSGRLVIGDTLGRRVFLVDTTGPAADVRPVALPLQTLDDIAAGPQEFYVADATAGRIQVLNVVPAPCD